MLALVDKFSALELCDRGQYKAAGDLLGIRVGEWPKNVSQSQSEQGMALLVAGIISTQSGRIQSEIDLGREMLTESVRLEGPLSHTARYWLAWAEYFAGDLDKALELVAEILAAPVDDVSRFKALLLRAVVYTDRELPERAWDELEQMAPFYEGCDSLRKGKFHNQRGRVLRMMGEMDRAIVEYDSAIYFSGEAGDVCHQAIASNNLAAIYLRTGQFDRAHVYAQQACDLFQSMGDKTREGQAWDHIASIFLAQAEDAANRGIPLVSGSGKTLIESKITLGKIKQFSELKSSHNDATMRTTAEPFSSPDLPSQESGQVMSPYDRALHLVDGNPEKAESLLYLLYWATSNPDDELHKAEVDGIYEAVHAKTDHGTAGRQAHRTALLIRPVT